MHLSIATPSKLLIESDDVRSLRAADASGSFGILPGHTDLLTVLPASVVEWREGDGEWRYCAVRSGVFSVSGGNRIAIACRQAVPGRALEELEAEVRQASAAETEADRRARVEQTRLHARAVRQLLEYLLPHRTHGGFPDSREVEL
jgi:F-type H+-transporting ATPase subunit epsilon